MSRGANFVTFIENSDDCITILKQNLKEFENNYKITKSSVDKFLQTSLSTYDIVFYDPPFKIETDVVKNEIMKIYTLIIFLLLNILNILKILLNLIGIKKHKNIR